VVDGGAAIGAIAYDRTGQPASRAWPFFDSSREQADDLSNAGRAQIRPAGGRVDPAKVGLAVELRQRIEECACSRVSRERRGDIVSSTVTSSPIAIPMPISRFGARVSAHPRPVGTSLARNRQPPIVPLTGWSALAPHASSGSNGTMMTALSLGPSAMTARKRCEAMTPSWHDGGDGERSVRSGQFGGADRQSSRRLRT
jgi:hypothetical protein